MNEEVIPKHLNFILQRKDINIKEKLQNRITNLKELDFSIISSHSSCQCGCPKVNEKKKQLKCPCMYDEVNKVFCIDFLEYLTENIENLITYKLLDAQLIINELMLRLNKLNNDLKKFINGEMYIYFTGEYNRFVNGNNNWGAYHYVDSLNVNVCPYCNSQFTFTVNTNEGKTRPDLDHFLAKSIYPFLAVSIYNLVPSCKICNSSFKGHKETDLQKNIYPFEEEFGNNMTFKRKLIAHSKEQGVPNYIKTVLGLDVNFEIELQINLEKEHSDYKKIDNNIKLFNLRDIYSNPYHKKYVNGIILKAYIYNEIYTRQLQESFPKIFSNKDELRYNILPIESEYKNDLLGKLTSDIILNETAINALIELNNLVE